MNTVELVIVSIDIVRVNGVEVDADGKIITSYFKFMTDNKCITVCEKENLFDTMQRVKAQYNKIEKAVAFV